MQSNTRNDHFWNNKIILDYFKHKIGRADTWSRKVSRWTELGPVDGSHVQVTTHQVPLKTVTKWYNQSDFRGENSHLGKILDITCIIKLKLKQEFFLIAVESFDLNSYFSVWKYWYFCWFSPTDKFRKNRSIQYTWLFIHPLSCYCSWDSLMNDTIPIPSLLRMKNPRS